MRSTRSRSKQAAYTRGFRAEARAHNLDFELQPTMPFSIEDDPTISLGMVEDLGRADARDIARGKRAT